jgi:hypothetical protein
MRRLPLARRKQPLASDVRLGVKLRRPQYEHMFSALPSNSDIAHEVGTSHLCQ